MASPSKYYRKLAVNQSRAQDADPHLISIEPLYSSWVNSAGTRLRAA
jgi:hypothetical protein